LTFYKTLIMHFYKTPPSDPFIIFNTWYQEVSKIDPLEARTVSLATVNYLGQPSLRMMVLYDVINHSFVFFTNMESRKALEIIDNPNVALCFNWPKTKQQVRIEGTAFKVSNELCDKAFATRPEDHQINILSSPQSRLLEDISILEQKVASVAIAYGDQPIPRPAVWGGFAVSPNRLEFWEEKPFWMHERLVYTDYQGEWSISKLYP
jgi:pyridoxamine 5'-phosphate oxidase